MGVHMVVEVVGNHCLKNNRDNIQYQQIKTKLVELGQRYRIMVFKTLQDCEMDT